MENTRDWKNFTIKYYHGPFGAENIGIECISNIDGKILSIPIDEKNSDYLSLMSAVDSGLVTIAEAE